ncbi:ABC transporter substrate-binding protein [Paenibacillus sp. PAMC21692]|uniref:ABC transporter substrate-binding protein n=1 Tax=Paenibacillus sp. PAMC21692 TaxID=2762320 RepID=UPI00164CEAE8|nr:extracellular solute-binding protein [Paenibacillus sp. PAMC21692]QNK55649.1 extracellular solute-binding protein [Paenibacillus sp. PAMC21692]
MRKKSNRAALGSLAVALAVTGILSGCSGNGNGNVNAGPSNNSSSSTAAPTPGKTVELKFSVLSARPGDEAFYKEQMTKFMESNPDIKVTTIANPTEQYNNALQLSFAANESPDLFFIEGGQPQARTVYDNKWVEPLDSYIDEAFMERFPDGAFSKTSQVRVSGEIIGLPVRDPRFDKVRPLYYNADILQEYGFTEPPKTHSEFVDMATAITKEAKGKAYGFAMMGKSPGVFGLSISGLGSGLEGGVIGYEGNTIINLKTGQYSSVSAAPVVDILRDLNANKIIAPGWENWEPAQMHQQFAAGKVAMFIGAAWQAEEIRKLNDGINMGIAAAPIPDAGRQGYRDTPTIAEPRYAMSSQSQNKEAAWKVLEFLGSLEFQKANYLYAKEIVVMPEAMEGVEMSKDMEQIVKVMDETIRMTPAVNTNNQDYDKFSKNISEAMPKPRIQEVFLKAVIENADPAPLAAEYDAKANVVIDEQIKIANEGGIAFKREDMTYPNWNPMENYIVE